MSVMRTTMMSRDTDVALAAIRGLSSGFDFRRDDDGRPFTFAVTSVSDGRLSVHRLSLGCSGRGRTDAQPTFDVSETTSDMSVTAGRRQLDVSQPFLHPIERIESSWTDRSDVSTIQVGIGDAEELAARFHDLPHLHIAFTGSAPVDVAHRRHWRLTSAYARAAASDPDAFANDLIRDGLFRMVVAALLADFANNTLDLGDGPGGAAAAPATVRRAIAFMEEHLAEPIGLAEIAEAARLSPRGLQSVFLRTTGVPPLRFLRSLRLSAAHADLIAADPTGGATVTGIAQRWGFGHIPRFAARYAAAYGEYPHETLNR